jgi:hypothetical protein
LSAALPGISVSDKRHAQTKACWLKDPTRIDNSNAIETTAPAIIGVNSDSW